MPAQRLPRRLHEGCWLADQMICPAVGARRGVREAGHPDITRRGRGAVPPTGRASITPPLWLSPHRVLPQLSAAAGFFSER